MSFVLVFQAVLLFVHHFLNMSPVVEDGIGSEAGTKPKGDAIGSRANTDFDKRDSLETAFMSCALHPGTKGNLEGQTAKTRVPRPAVQF